MDSRRPRPQRSPDPFDRRLDRWLDTGRQLVDGVSGGRPGRREWIVSMGHPAWMRWVAGWVIASIGCWMKKTTGGNRPNLRRAGTAHARHRARLFLRLPVEWSDQCLLGGSVPSRPSRDGSPCSHHRQRWSRTASAPSVQPDPVVSEADDAWPDDDNFRVDRWKRSSGVIHHRLIYHRLTLHRWLRHAPPPGDRCLAPVAAAIEQLLALKAFCATVSTAQTP